MAQKAEEKPRFNGTCQRASFEIAPFIRFSAERYGERTPAKDSLIIARQVVFHFFKEATKTSGPFALMF